MSTEKKDVKVVKKENAKPTKEYVRFRQMRHEDVYSLPRFKANVTKTKSKRGNMFYQLSVRFDRLLTINIPLTEVEFNLIVMIRGLNENKPINTLDIWARLLQGPKEDGIWQRWELFVCRDVYFDGMFTNQEMTMMEVADIELPFIKVSTKLDTIDEFDEEAQEDYKKRLQQIF